MRLYRMKYFNAERPHGQKLLDLYILSKDAAKADGIARGNYAINRKDSHIHELIASNGTLFIPSRHSNDLQLYKTSGTAEVYVVDKSLDAARKRLIRNGFQTMGLHVEAVRKPFIASGLRKR
jgi:hypothetical protein